jgi:hypothetical protein
LNAGNFLSQPSTAIARASLEDIFYAVKNEKAPVTSGNYFPPVEYVFPIATYSIQKACHNFPLLRHHFSISLDPFREFRPRSDSRRASPWFIGTGFHTIAI